MRTPELDTLWSDWSAENLPSEKVQANTNLQEVSMASYLSGAAIYLMCSLRQEEERRRREEEMLRKREMEEQMRRQREENYRMGGFMDVSCT